MSQAISPSVKKPYGIKSVSRAWRLARATVLRHKALANTELQIPVKRGLTTCPSDEQIFAEIHAVPASSLFAGEGHRKVWARLRHECGACTWVGARFPETPIWES